MARFDSHTVLFVTLMLTACGGSDYAISEQNLSGVVGGEAWSFVEGETNAFLSDDDYFASLYSQSFEPCGMGTPSGTNSLILNIPMETGEWTLSLSRNMTFVVHSGSGTDNLIGTDGLLRVDEITTDSIVGGIYAEYDGDNTVDGTFTVTICE